MLRLIFILCIPTMWFQKIRRLSPPSPTMVSSSSPVFSNKNIYAFQFHPEKEPDFGTFSSRAVFPPQLSLSASKSVSI